jgi:hypothetical protein
MKKEILIEYPLHRLYTDTLSHFSTEREKSQLHVQVNSYEAIPSIDDRELKYTFDTSSTGKNYQTIITFKNVKYLDNETPTSVKIEAVDGSEYNIEPIQYGLANVKVKCTCLDFYYRFATWNNRDKALEGNPPPPYVKKSNRPPVNPDQISGLCKHLMKSVDFLGDEKILK